MADPVNDDLAAALDRLIGRWQCYDGDGVHGWDERVITFARDGVDLTVDEFIPASPAGWPRTPIKRGPYVARCSRGAHGWDVALDDKDGDGQSLWHLRGLGPGDTFALWQTGVGIITPPRYNQFRRVIPMTGS